MRIAQGFLLIWNGRQNEPLRTADTVFVVAIAVKEGNKFIIEGQEYPL
jgi:hypothetical protein